MSELLLPVCTFLRVFDTSPCSEVLTLPELTAALRRFEVKPQTVVKIEREIGRIRQAVERARAGETPRGKYMGKLVKAAEKARASGDDPSAAIAGLAQELEEDQRRSAKRDLRLWSPALYRPGRSKRGSENVTHVSCLVLDYDDGTPIADASVTWSAFFHIVHTTWSHTAEHPKFRVVMPLAFPVPAEDWGKVWSWAEELARFEIDPAMKSPAATYALPAVPHRDWPREAFSRPGAILDPVDEGILERRISLALEPKRPPPGVPSAIRGEDPDHEYVDHEDPDAVYFVDEEWGPEEAWDASAELVAAVRSQARPLVSEKMEAPTEEGVPVEVPGAVTEDVVRAGAPLEPGGSKREEFDMRALLERLEQVLGQMERLTEGAGIASALERLVALHEDGWLSPEELAVAKAHVLGEPRVEPGQLRRVGPGRHRQTLAIDFDGVIHAYTSGWRGTLEIPDPPVEGAIAWLAAAAERFDLAIFSVRANAPGAIDAMRAWLRSHGLPDRVLERIRFPAGKPPAELYIDDRGYRFDGTFPSFDELGALEPWTRRVRTRR